MEGSARRVQPFLEEDSALLSVFPPRWWAHALPALLGGLATTGVLGYIGWVLLASQLYRCDHAGARGGAVCCARAQVAAPVYPRRWPLW
jgi:hypothetical protein